MEKIITYSLYGDNHTSDDYYKAVARLVDQWLPAAMQSVSNIVSDFRRYRTDLGHPDRTDAEYAFELLVLGVLLREHGAEAERWPMWATLTMVASTHVPEYWGKLEPASKKMRGWVANLARHVAMGKSGNAMDVDKLLAWMRAHGQETRANRLQEWRGFLEPLASASSQRALVMVIAMADDFERMCRGILSPYTTGVEVFRAEAASRYAKRYDAELVTRTRLEYHLGMVGTEILNRSNREKFLSTRRRVVILPPCMRARSDEECKATATGLGSKCQACTPGCHVNQISRLGEKHGFEVYMIPGEMHHIGRESARTDGGIGLVGVSCALTNWSGGWDTEGLHVPAQGVLLDYAGCKYHWDDRGIETSVNIRQIETMATEQPATPVMKAA